MLDTLSYHNFSWRGDPRWADASRVTLYAPLVVVFTCFLSIAQIALGSVWIVSLKDTMTVPKIIQTLLIPGCSFFNTIPSLHLHLLIRQNPPKLAIWFSSLFAFVYLFSTLLMLGTCASAPSAPRGLAHSECPRGIRGGPTIGVDRNVWDVFQVMSLLSVVAYSVHAAMAIYVLRDQKRKKALGLLIEDPEVVAARRAKAREQWIQMTRQHGGNA